MYTNPHQMLCITRELLKACREDTYPLWLVQQPGRVSEHVRGDAGMHGCMDAWMHGVILHMDDFCESDLQLAAHEGPEQGSRVVVFQVVQGA